MSNTRSVRTWMLGAVTAACLGLFGQPAWATVYQGTFSGTFINASNFGATDIQAGDAFSAVLTYDSDLLFNVYMLPVVNNVQAGYATTNNTPLTDPSSSTVTMTDQRSGAVVTIVSNYYAEVTAGTDGSTMSWQNQIQQDGAYTTFDLYIQAPVGQFPIDQFAVDPANPTDATLAADFSGFAYGSIIVYDADDQSFGRAQFAVGPVNLSSDADVPEPASLTVLGAGLAGLTMLRRRKARAN